MYHIVVIDPGLDIAFQSFFLDPDPAKNLYADPEL
jgi:hypothetical protein